MPEVDYLLGGPQSKWGLALLDLRVSVLSNGPVQFSVAASNNGLVYDPRGASPSAAFLPVWGNPAAGDWHPCTWGVTTIGLYVAQINLGPSGIGLPVGTYYAWLKVDDSASSGEIPIQQVGRLIIQ